MNETNIKHDYSLMVREVRGAILNPGAQISKAGADFMVNLYFSGGYGLTLTTVEL